MNRLVLLISILLISVTLCGQIRVVDDRSMSPDISTVNLNINKSTSYHTPNLSINHNHSIDRKELLKSSVVKPPRALSDIERSNIGLTPKLNEKDIDSMINKIVQEKKKKVKNYKLIE